jgi:predicted SprT family Zn-dependent metalloprotease
MKVFSLYELQQFEAYPILKHILNDAEIQVFFNTPEAQRGSMIPNKSVRRVNEPTPTVVFTPKPTPIVVFTPTPKKVSTEMCTEVSKSTIYRMAMDYMGRDFDYRGTTYNLNDLGWRFEFSNKKRALGTCISSRYTRVGRIQLSEWVITNSKETYDKWVNTMLHEIAHAIDVTIQGVSSHDYQWQNIARSIGCDAERTTSVQYEDLLANPISKYTMVCPNGHTSPSHKRKTSHRKSSCNKCNEAIGLTGFNSDFIIKQIQNW